MTQNDEEQAAIRRKIIRRYARLTASGTPKFCHAGSGELADRAEAGLNKPPTKVIFDSVEAAQDCERELRVLDGVPQWAYECHRSRRGHAHLSRKPPIS